MSKDKDKPDAAAEAAAEAAKLAAGIAPPVKEIEPTIGRVVWYWPHTSENLAGPEQPLAALVCFVKDTRLVNLAVFDPRGIARPKVDVLLRQPGDDKPTDGRGYAEWMPYQTGQAAKAQALTEQLAAAEKGGAA